MSNDRFIKLLTRHLNDQLTDAQREEFSRLILEDEGCALLKKNLEEYWKTGQAHYGVNAAMFKRVLEKIRLEEAATPAADITPRTGYEDPAPVPDPARPAKEGYRPPPHRKYRIIAWSAAAAIGMGAALLLTFHSPQPSQVSGPPPASVLWLETATRPTVKSTITLPDSTRITLNSATVLRYPDSFRNGVREVYLDGEAFFDVAKDPLRPFIIHANKINIKVLGTTFNIKSYQTEPLSEATLIKGSIEVTLNDRPSDRIILRPREKLIVHNNGILQKTAAADAGNSGRDSTTRDTRYSLTNLTYFQDNRHTVVETSWVENKLVFSNQSFLELSGQLERWYGVHIEFGSSKVEGYRFTGLFRKESLPEVLDALSMVEHFKYKINDTTVTIY